MRLIFAQGESISRNFQNLVFELRHFSDDIAMSVSRYSFEVRRNSLSIL